AQTQFCMDIDVLRRYVARLAEHGLDKKLSLIIGIAPLRSAKSARWMKDKLFGSIIPEAMIERMERSSDGVEEGCRMAIELIEQVARIQGVSGVHIMAPNNDDAVPVLIREARQRLG